MPSTIARRLDCSVFGTMTAAFPSEQHMEEYMRRALTVARQNPSRPYGAVIIDAQSGETVATGVNRVERNAVWHAELEALWTLNRGRRVRPSTCLIFSTAEPCPMCQAAIEYTGLRGVVYGAASPWLARHGWKQFRLSAAFVHKKAPWSDLSIRGGVLAAECRDLFRAARPGGAAHARTIL